MSPPLTSWILTWKASDHNDYNLCNSLGFLIVSFQIEVKIEPICIMVFFNERELKYLVWHQMLCKYWLIINLQLATNPWKQSVWRQLNYLIDKDSENKTILLVPLKNITYIGEPYSRSDTLIRVTLLESSKNLLWVWF